MTGGATSYMRGAWRQIVVLFVTLALLVLVPAFFFLYSWIISSRTMTDERLLLAGYNTLAYGIGERRHFLEKMAVLYQEEPAVRDSVLAGRRAATQARLGELKRKTGVDLLTVLDERGRPAGGDIDEDIVQKGAVNFRAIMAGMAPQTTISGFLYNGGDDFWLVALTTAAPRGEPLHRRGGLILAYRATPSFFRNTGERIGLELAMIPSGRFKGELSESAQSWKELVYSQRSYFIQRARQGGNETVTLSALIRDIRGDAVGLFVLKGPADSSAVVDRSFLLFAWMALALVVLAVIWVFRLLDRRLSAPLVRLRTAIREIASSGNLSKRLPVDTRDEMGVLVDEFNEMLDTLENLNNRVRRSNEEINALYKDLLDQNKFTSEILAASASLVVVLTPDGRVKFVNDAIERIAGFKTQEVIGRNWFENFLPFRIRDQVRRVFEDILQGKIQPYGQNENEILTRDGQERTILWHNSVLSDKDARIAAVLATGQDVTEFMAMERELRRKMADMERFYRVMIDREKVVIRLKKEIEELRGKG